MFTGETFLLGTDDQGRDVFSTILLRAAQSRCSWAFAAVGFAMVLRITLGLIAGYVGGVVTPSSCASPMLQLTFPRSSLRCELRGRQGGSRPPEYRMTWRFWGC